MEKSTSLLTGRQVRGPVQQIIAARDTIGWDGFCFGIIHKEWSQQLQIHFSHQGKRASGVGWMSKILRKV